MVLGATASLGISLEMQIIDSAESETCGGGRRIFAIMSPPGDSKVK